MRPVLELREALGEQVAAIRSHGPKVYVTADPEEVHQLRVAIRRLRALLRAARPLITDERAEPLRAELGELGRELGAARDADVFAAYLRNEAVSMDGDAPALDLLIARVEDERQSAYARARAAIDAPGHLLLLEKLDDFVAGAQIADGLLDDVVDRELDRFRRAAKDVDSDEGLHNARITAKRVRYAAEVAGKKKLVDRMRKLQDAAGEHQDAVVAERRLRSLVDRETALVVGRLIERQRDRRRSARKAWSKLA
jgi:CHAD domain-containing protein